MEIIIKRGILEDVCKVANGNKYRKLSPHAGASAILAIILCLYSIQFCDTTSFFVRFRKTFQSSSDYRFLLFQTRIYIRLLHGNIILSVETGRRSYTNANNIADNIRISHILDGW